MTKLSIVVDVPLVDPARNDPEVVAETLLSDEDGNSATFEGDAPTFLSAEWLP